MTLRCLVFLTPNTPAYYSYMRMMYAFGKAFSNDKGGNPILFLESIGLEYIIEFAKKYSNKKDALVHIIMAICPADDPLKPPVDKNLGKLSEGDSMKLRVLKRIEKLLGADYKTLSGLLAHMSVYQGEEGFEGEIFDFYWTKAVEVLNSSNPKMKTNGLKILNEISRFNFNKMPDCYATLRVLCSEVWWEIKAQILIICANQLELFEILGPDDKSMNNKSQMHNTQEHGEETIEAAIPKIDPSNQSQHLEQTGKQKSTANNRSQMNDFEKTHESKGGPDFDKQHSIVNLLDLVFRIFNTSANLNVQKIGLVYLAKVLNYYPELCARYLEVLLCVDDDVRETVLNIEESNKGEYNIVLSKVMTSNCRFNFIQVQDFRCSTPMVFERNSRGTGPVRSEKQARIL